MVLRAAVQGMESAILVSGDRDFYPAIDRTRALGVDVGLITSKNSSAKWHPNLDLGVKYIEDIRDQIRRETVKCECPNHNGDPWIYRDTQVIWEYPFWCERCVRGSSRVDDG